MLCSVDNPTFTEEFFRVADVAGMSAEDVADEFGRNARTVSNWRSKGIPNRTLPHAREILERWREERAEALEDQVLTLKVSGEDFDRFDRASRRDGLLLREWLLDAVERAAAIEEGRGLRVAEGGRAYKPEKTTAPDNRERDSEPPN